MSGQNRSNLTRSYLRRNRKPGDLTSTVAGEPWDLSPIDERTPHPMLIIENVFVFESDGTSIICK